MVWLRRLVGGAGALVRRRRTEQALDEELRAYLDASIEQNVRAGMMREDAIRAARVQMGSLAAVKDHIRDVGWEAGLESVWHDVRHAARTLRRSPAFSATAVLTMALGIGANTAMFSAINALMLRPLPVAQPEELVSLQVIYPRGTDPVFSYAAYRQFAHEAAAGFVRGSRPRGVLTTKRQIQSLPMICSAPARSTWLDTHAR